MEGVLLVGLCCERQKERSRDPKLFKSVLKNQQVGSWANARVTETEKQWHWHLDVLGSSWSARDSQSQQEPLVYVALLGS